MAYVQRTKSATPRPSRLDEAAFLNEVIGRPDRSPRPFPIYATLGDVIDTEPTEHCVFWKCYFQEAKSRMPVVREPCGKVACPRCVIDWLLDRIAPAWCYWDGKASWSLVEFAEHGHSGRGLPVRLRGKNATPGALAIKSSDGTRIYFASAGILEHDAVGPELNTALRDWIRAVPTARDPDDKLRQAPDDARVVHVKNEGWLLHAAHLAGMEIVVDGDHRKELTGTIEQFRHFRALMKGAA